MSSTILIGSDHAAVEMKRYLKERLEQDNFSIKDVWTPSAEPIDYPDIAHPLAELISTGQHEIGILICGSGNGMAMTANKHAWIRAGLCRDKEIASLARKHNDANILCMPWRYIPNEVAYEIVKVFLTTEFEWWRHEKRVQKINK